MKIVNKRAVYLGLAGVIVGIAYSYFIAPYIPYRIGLIYTPSIDKHLVVYDLKATEIKKGKLYTFLFPKDTKYYKKGQKFTKYAKCIEGDRLEVVGLDFYCNGKKIATARTTDSKGNPVSHFEYNGTIPKGKIFMYAPHYRSYDSRYWGFLDRKNIIGEVKWAL